MMVRHVVTRTILAALTVMESVAMTIRAALQAPTATMTSVSNSNYSRAHVHT